MFLARRGARHRHGYRIADRLHLQAAVRVHRHDRPCHDRVEARGDRQGTQEGTHVGPQFREEQMTIHRMCAGVVLAAVAWTAPVLAQESTDELAKKLSNPVASL